MLTKKILRSRFYFVDSFSILDFNPYNEVKGFLSVCVYRRISLTAEPIMEPSNSV